MKLPQHKNPVPNREALAPYNFVPLPEKVLSGEVSDLDAYHAGQHTGWFECELTTETPLYVRCGLWPDEDKPEKDRPDFFTDPLTHQPVIPGSSLRGMLRSMVEIISYSKVQPVTNELKVTFRAVAAKSDDPLAQPYKDALRDVKVGYLHKHGDSWSIQPAQRPASLRLPERGAYLKVKDRSGWTIPDLTRFRQEGYHPQYHRVRFDCETARDKHGKEYVRVVNLGGEDSTGKYAGALVCSGNMAESGDASSSRRKNYALVLERDPHAPSVPIPKQVIQDYVDALTDFQREPPFDKRYGCLIEGYPVFYLEANKQVVAFGHTPNFRVPAQFIDAGNKRAATPLDFVPKVLRNPEQTDLAEALFGYVEEKSTSRDVARAGRVCVTDARLNDGQSDISVSDAPITPKILGGPKSTTFQHYLVQEYPNDKKSLRHYASPTPDETVIRGHKLYWHKRNLQRSDWEETPDKIKPGGDTQHTQIKPIREGVAFHFRIYFDDLSDHELGALTWLLKLAAANDYRFKLGMGKPLGLGSISVTATLHLTQRPERYSHLFTTGDWATGEGDGNTVAAQAQAAFEQWILSDKEINPQNAGRLEEVDRIKMLLFLLQWPGPDKEKTRYLEIEHGMAKENEYKDRPVLPTPEGVINSGKPASTSPASSSGRPPAKPQQASPASRKAPQAPAAAKPQPPAASTLAPPAKSQTVIHPKTVEEIRVGDLLEGKVTAVDANSIKFDFGLDATGSMGLERLDNLVRTHPYFKEVYPEFSKPTALMLYKEGDLGEDLYGTQMQVRVLKIEQRHGKTLIKVDFEKWLD